MKISKLDNNFEDKKSSTITLYNTCCCCCCCCILTPIGGYLAEKAVQRSYNYNHNLAFNTFINFIFLIISLLPAYYWINDMGFPALTISAAIYSILLGIFSFYWIPPEESLEVRFQAVAYQVLVSIVLYVIFFFASFLLLFLLPLFG